MARKKNTEATEVNAEAVTNTDVNTNVNAEAATIPEMRGIAEAANEDIMPKGATENINTGATGDKNVQNGDQNAEKAKETNNVQEEEKGDISENTGDKRDDFKPNNAENENTAAKRNEYVDYCLPFLPGKKKGDAQTVTINGKNYQVQYGVPVKVPQGVKEILEEMVMQNELVDRRIRELTAEEKCLAKFE